MRTKFDTRIEGGPLEQQVQVNGSTVKIVRTSTNSWLVRCGWDEAVGCIVREVREPSGVHVYWHTVDGGYPSIRFQGTDGLGNKAQDRCLAHLVRRYFSNE